MNTDDPDFETDYTAANAELMGYAYNMAEERRRCPADDIVTRLIEADIDGEALDDVEFAFFVILLAVAGNETTRNAMTHGMNAFFENPDQWELFKRERPATAADEIVRWATPVHCFQRTALADTELGGVTIREGQRAGLFYSSANYDEAVFDRPFQFDICRDPNPHLGVRRQRRALLHRRQPGAHGDQADFQRDRRPDPEHRETVRTATASVGVDQRGQGAAGLLPTADVASRRAYPRLVWIGAGKRRRGD